MGHLINPIQFRLGYSLFNNKNWPALNKEQYMLCYNIQKDFTDYFKTLFSLRKKLVLKRRNRKRRLYTKVKHPRLIFSSCNVNFFGFNLHRVLVDVTIFDMRFESKWDLLFSRKYFENFLFKFGEVFRTTKVLSEPSFFINIKKELLKKFFIILNKQYHLVHGTLISQTTKWVKSYLAKIYQKFFSFFNDSAYLVNKRRTLRKAKQYIKKRTKDQHVSITLKYKKVQKRKFLKNWSKLFLFLNPIITRSSVVNKNKINKIKKILLKNNKYLFNFTDLFDVYFKLLTHKFAKKVRRRDLPRFHKLVESSKTHDYYKSILKTIKYGLSRIKTNKAFYSLIPMEDKIRLYKIQSHFYLKYIILKKNDVPIERYKRLTPVHDLYEKFFKKFDILRPYIVKLNKQSELSKDIFSNLKIQSEIIRFYWKIKLLNFLAKTYLINLGSVFKNKRLSYRSHFFLRLPQNKRNNWYYTFFKKIIYECYSTKKNIKNKYLKRLLRRILFVKTFKFKKRVFFEKYKNEKIKRTTIVKRRVRKEPYCKIFPIRTKKSFILKNILKNWIVRDGNIWLDKILSRIFYAISKKKKAKKAVLINYRKLLFDIRNHFKYKKKVKQSLKLTNFHKILKHEIYNLFVPFAYKKKRHIWNVLERHKSYYKTKLNLYNKLYNNNNIFNTLTEMQHAVNDYNIERERVTRGSVVPLSTYKSKYKKPKAEDDESSSSDDELNLPAFGVNNEYKHFEANSLLANVDPALSEKRANRNYYYKLDPFFQRYMKLQKIKSLQINVKVDLGSKRMITARFLTAWLKSLFKKGRRLTYVLKTLDRFIKPANNYISAVSVLFAGRFTRSAYTTYKYYRFGRLNNGEITKQMDYSHIEFTTKFGMCGIKVKLQYKPNIYANRDLANYLKTAILGSEISPYVFNSQLHLPMLIRYGSKKLLRFDSKLHYRNNLPHSQFK